MKSFIARYADKITGVLSGFDRLVFRGTLRKIAFVVGMFGFMWSRRILLKDFGRFAQVATEHLKEASLAKATELGRPVLFLPSSTTSKEEVARRIAQRDDITQGLVCVLKSVELCRTFDIHRNREAKRLELVCRERKCEYLYHYMIDPVFGFMYARIQTWLPFNIQVGINGREWLSRQMDRAGVGYEREDNCFPRIDDVTRAQKLMNKQLRLHWPSALNRLARVLNPAHAKILGTHQLTYYWTVHQSEWATDFMFRDHTTLTESYHRLARHGISAFSSGDVMRFLGRKVNGNFQGQIVSDFKDRPEGVRIKHFVGKNSVKAYDKPEILRVETTIHDASGIKVFRPTEGDGRAKRAWLPMRKGIADLHRRTQVSQASNDRYADALAAADTTTSIGKLVEGLDQCVRWKGRRVRGLHAWSSDDLDLFRAVNRGEFKLNGFRNRDLQAHLFKAAAENPEERRRRSARVSRLLRLLRAHRLIRKMPKTNRYNLTQNGQSVLTALLAIQDVSLAQLNKAA